MYVWTRKEIAEAFDVSRATPHYWSHNYGPDSNHPFPEPVARLQVGGAGTTHWGMHQFVFDPGEVQNSLGRRRFIHSAAPPPDRF